MRYHCSSHVGSGVFCRTLIVGLSVLLAAIAGQPAAASAAGDRFDVTFLFTSDIHACRMQHGLSPHCDEEGKTEQALRRHVAGMNRVPHHRWPRFIKDAPTGLHGAGEPIAPPLGVVIGGDMTDDGGGQVQHPGGPLPRPGHPNLWPGDGRQLAQFDQLYRQNAGGDAVRYPVYHGLGNHDLDQDGPPQAFDWYRDELRGYVKANHMPAPGDRPPVPVTSYDAQSDCYSWDWGELHLLQAHRYAGDTNKGATDSLPWIKRDLASRASDRRPVIVIQHYGWDSFSTERWDPAKKTFTPDGAGPPHWWSESEWQAEHAVLEPHNVIAVLHGHEHENTLHYQWHGIDVIKPRAGFLGGFAILRVTERFMDVVFAEVIDDMGNLRFTKAFSKALSPARPERR